MDGLIQDYLQVLNKEIDLLDKLLKFGESKKGLIILGKVQELDKLLQKEGLIVANLEKTEKLRCNMHEQMARQWDMPLNELTAVTLINKFNENLPLYAHRLKQTIDEIETIVSRLGEINQENNELINMSLEYIDNVQAMLIGDLAGTYSENGTQTSENVVRPTFRMIDKKA